MTKFSNLRKWQPRMKWMTSLFLVCPLVTMPIGCGTGSISGVTKPTTTATNPAQVTGRVHGGQQPISGATIQLWTVGTSQVGQLYPSTALISATLTTSDGSGNASNSNANVGNANNSLPAGNFILPAGSYTCTSATEVYIAVTGGNSGSGSNPGIALVAALGACSALSASTFIQINEVTTVAAAYALAPFATGLADIGTAGANAPGLLSAFANASLLANVSTGQANGTIATGVTAPMSELNTLANIMASCVNTGYTTGSTSGNCYTLFSTTGATDTFGAALAIAKNPGSSAITALYSLASSVSPFQPSLPLASTPNDFSLAITIAGAGSFATPYGLAVDGSGDVWVANASGVSMTELASDGTVMASPTATSLAGAQGTAIDPSGNVWVANTAGNSVIKLTVSNGNVTGTNSFTNGGINGPSAIAIDSTGNVFVTNLNGNSVTALNNSGTAISGSPFTGTSNSVMLPTGIAVDQRGDVYVTSGSGSVVKFTNNSGALTQSAVLSDSRLQAPSAIALDSSGRVVATGYTTGTAVLGALSEFGATGNASTGSPYTPGLTAPAGIASDGTSIWVTNAVTAGGLVQVAYGTSSAKTSSLGLGTLNAPVGVAIDASGSVWTANSGSNTVSKFIGLAVPVAGTLSVDAAHGSDVNNGSPSSPFASISRCLSIVTAGQTCQVHAGIYDELVAPTTNNITIAAYPGDTAIISTADTVANWTSIGNGIYTANVTVNTSVPPVNGYPQQFPGYQLFYNGIAVPQAQYPVPSSNALTPNWATINSATSETSTSNGTTTIIPATITDANAPALATTGATIHIWSGTDPYTEYAGIVQSAPGGSVTYLADDIVASNTAMAGGLYYIAGAKELLSANTWYYDAAGGVIYWQPPNGIDPNDSDIRFRQRYAAVDLSGRTNITLKDIQLFGGGVVMNSNSGNNTMDGMTATYLSSEEHPHSYGPAADRDLYSFGISLDGDNNTIENSTIAYSNLSGITISGGSGNIVQNNLIHDVDLFGDDAAAIQIGESGPASIANTLVAQNTIYNVGRSALDVTANATDQVNRLSVTNNNMFNGMYLSIDGGAIYICCGTQLTGTVIQNNWIHDQVLVSSYSYPATGGSTFPRGGIYSDSGIGGYQASNNILWNSPTELFVHGTSGSPSTPQFPVTNVNVSNNTVADASDGCNLFSSGLSSGSSAITFANNLIYFAPALGSGSEGSVSYSATNNSPSGAGSSTFATPGCTFTGCLVGNSPPTFPAGAPSGGATAHCPS